MMILSFCEDRISEFITRENSVMLYEVCKSHNLPFAVEKILQFLKVNLEALLDSL